MFKWPYAKATSTDSIKAEEKKKFSDIEIHLKNGKPFCLQCPLLYDNWTKITPWRDFYKWYFGRSGDSYIFRYAKAETMILRDNIFSFTVREIEKDKDS